MAVLVASGVALSASSYAHITQVLHVNAKSCWTARCPSFSNKVQAELALALGPFFGYLITHILVPLATCMHPLLYMAVAPSLSCHPCHLCQDLPLEGTTTHQLSP